jgi:hypothetical protein
VRIEYTAPASCPNEHDFIERVRERIVRSRFAKPDEMARTFRVTVTSKPERSVARVEFVDANGENVSRTIGADTCDEVVNAIALVTALAMEARAGEEVPKPGAPPPSRTPQTPRAEPRAKPSPPSATVSHEPRAHWDAGVGVELASGYAPSLTVGLRLFVEWLPASWSVRVSASHADSGKVSVEGRRARMQFWGGRAEACPLRLALAEHWQAIPCAGLDLGALRGEGIASDEIDNPETTTELWLAPSVIARLQADLDQFLLLEAALDARFPLLRHEFFFEPDNDFYTVPAIAFGASLGIGFRFH